MYRHLAILLGAVILPGFVLAQPNDAVRIAESFAKDAQYHVACQVEIAGTLTLPAGKDGKTAPLKVTGKSSIKYDERILQLTNDRKVDRTARYYQQLDFERKVGDEVQQSKLRPEVRRLVILRYNQYEVPFSPSGPLTWGEIELVRTDVFGPALAGLFPEKAVRVGERWRADNQAIQELTDLERIDKADFTCTLEKISTLLGRRTARVLFEGKVQGVGEDGNALHEMRGVYDFDLDGNFLTYVYVKGIHHMLDKSGNATGKIEGSFVMTRARTPVSREIADDALRGLTLEPNADNTLLLFDHPQIGIRFTYPRNWRIAGFNDKQIGIDENRGSGVLITLAPAAQTPTGAQFFQEAAQFLGKQKATLRREDKLRTVGGWETFGFEVDIGKDRVLMQYHTTRQSNFGATLTARIVPAHTAEVQRDIDRIARSIQLRGTK